MSRRLFTLLASMLLIVIFIAANALAQRWTWRARIDFTQGKLYSLTEETRKLVSELGEPVELTLVYSRTLAADFPAIRAHGARVEEMLNAYVSASGGDVRVSVIDPMPFSEAEDEAITTGITPIRTNGGDNLYLGLIGRNLADDELVLPYLAPEQDTTLEYDVTRLIARLDAPDPPRIGILSGLPGLTGDAANPGYLIQRDLAAAYRLEPIAPDFVRIDADLDLLILAHPPALDRRQLYLIDQFLMRRGRMLVFIDPVGKAAQLYADPFAGRDTAARSDLDGLLGAYGLGMTDRVVASPTAGLPERVNYGSGVDDQPLYMRARPTGNMAITAPLSRDVHIGAGGAIEVSADTGLEVRTLVESPEDAGFVDPALAIDSASPRRVLNAISDPLGPAAIAVDVSGALASAFDARIEPDLPDDPVLREMVMAEMADPPAHLPRSDGEVRLIVVADSDLLDDGFYVDPGTGLPVADNRAFVLNAVDALANRFDLNALRARAPALRPMARVDRLYETALEQFIDRQAALEAELADDLETLERLRLRGAGSAFLERQDVTSASPEDQAEFARVTARVTAARAELREIEAALRQRLDRLELGLKRLNIWTMPILVLLAGFVGLAIRRRRTG